MQMFGVLAGLGLQEYDSAPAALFFWVPIGWFGSVISAALSFDFVWQLEHGQVPQIGRSLKRLQEKLLPLLLESLIIGVPIILGSLLVLPGLYFFTIYLFVPGLVMVRPPSPAFSYLAESTLLARGRFFKLMFFSAAVFVASYLSYLYPIPNPFQNASWEQTGTFALRFFSCLFLNGGINIFAGFLFARIMKGGNSLK